MIIKATKSVVFGICLAFAATSQAGLYWDLDVYSASEGYVTATDSLTGTFDITGSGLGGGFVGAASGGTETVDWAFFEFTLVDDRDGTGQQKTESWQIDLGQTDFASGGSLSGYWLTFVLGFGNATLYADIQADGRVNYEISATSGDFRVINGLMKVGTVTGSNDNRVPDGGLTLALLGGGILSLCALRRRF